MERTLTFPGAQAELQASEVHGGLVAIYPGVMAGSKTANPQSMAGAFTWKVIYIYRWWIFHDFSVELALTYLSSSDSTIYPAPIDPQAMRWWSDLPQLEVGRLENADHFEATNVPISGRYPFSRRWEQLRASVDIYRFFSDIYIFIEWSQCIHWIPLILWSKLRFLFCFCRWSTCLGACSMRRVGVSQMTVVNVISQLGEQGDMVDIGNIGGFEGLWTLVLPRTLGILFPSFTSVGNLLSPLSPHFFSPNGDEQATSGMQFQHKKRCCSWVRFEYLVYPLTRLNVAVIAQNFSHQFDDFRPWGFCRFPISQPSLMKPEGIYPLDPSGNLT